MCQPIIVAIHFPNPDTIQDTRTNIHIKLSLRDTPLPSLENWDGGLMYGQ